MRPNWHPRLGRTLLVVLGISALPVTVLAFRPETSTRGGAVAVTRAALPVSSDSGSGALRVARRASVLGHDPFRRSRTAPGQSYDAAALNRAQQLAAAPPPPKPTLLLTGVVWGTRPSALIEGIPGQEGARLLRPGDTAGGIRLRSLTQTRAVLVGFDTVWSLVIREPWK